MQVEEHDMVEFSLQEILQKDGFLAVAAPGVAEALDLLQREFYHVMFLDLHIQSGPAITDGIDLLNEMKTLGLSEGIKVLVLSAYGNMERVREVFRDHKVADFLSKENFTRQI